MVVQSNALSTVAPTIASQWHPTLNGLISPDSVTAHSNKRFWWKCDKGSDHEWQATPGDRSQGKGCPYCAGRKVSVSNSLATIRPELHALWHPSKNGELTPHHVTNRSHKEVWWQCDRGHEWKVRISYVGGCPQCSNQRISDTNSLSHRFPEVAREWHPTKNGALSPDDLIAGTSKRVWWQCPKHITHEYQANVSSRTSRGSGCPYCAGKLVNETNSLATTDPSLCTEWHESKNGTLTPDQVTRGSDQTVWWRCHKGPDHEYQAPISKRTILERGCAVCSGNVVVPSTCLATLKPKVASEWHPLKNKSLKPTMVTPGSGQKIWWQCSKDPDHEWPAVISSRAGSQAVGCPYCDLTPQSRQELMITFELKTIWPSINPKGFKTRVKEKLWTIDIFIPELHLGIEFDGSYWHKSKQDLDKMKTRQLESSGLKILRIRESPLRKISQTDIISPKPFQPKDVVIRILDFITCNHDLDENTKTLIADYTSDPDLRGQKKLEAYISRRLTRKKNRAEIQLNLDLE